MTPLPHNPAITVIDLPEDAASIELHTNEDKPYVTYHVGSGTDDYDILRETLPPGNYKLICLGNQATEEEAREIVEADGMEFNGKVSYGYCNYAGGLMTDTALQSLASLITANGWKNPVFLRNV